MTLRISPRTVVEALLPFDGDVPLDLVFDTANQVGITDQPLRLAVRRLVAAGDVIQVGRGRSGTLQPTAQGRQHLSLDRQALALAWAQDSGKARWDRRWRLISASIPEQQRSIRDTVRRRLTGLGAIAISTGLYVSPHDLRHALPREAEPWLVTATTEDLVFHGQADPTEMAETLWPAGPTVNTYRVLDAALREKLEDTGLPDTAKRLYIAQAYEDAMRDDPLLPTDLRRGIWEPTEIRQGWAQMWVTTATGEAQRIYDGWTTSGSE